MYETNLCFSPLVKGRLLQITRGSEKLEKLLAGAVFAMVYAYVFDVEEVKILFAGKWKNTWMNFSIDKKKSLRDYLPVFIENTGDQSEIGADEENLKDALVIAGESSVGFFEKEENSYALFVQRGEYRFKLKESRQARLLPLFIQRFITDLEEYLDLPFEKIHLENTEERESILQWGVKKSIDKQSFQELFEKNLKQHGHRTAYEVGDQKVSFQEVNDMAEKLRKELKGCGVQEYDVVAVECGNNPWTLISALALAKLGAIYFPLDRTLPPKKQKTLLQSSKACKLLREGKVVDTSVEDWDRERAREQYKDILQGERGSYLIFTSGTTGEPKGCLVSENNMINLCLWYEKEFCLDTQSKVILLNNFSFDASVKNIYTPLLCGSQIVFGPEHIFDTFALAHILEKYQVTHVNCVPGLFDALLKTVSYEHYRQLESLRYVIMGGESFLLPEVKRWARLPRCTAEFGNVYGPAECTSVSTYYHCNKEELLERDVMPIGYPIDGKKLYLVNSMGKLCLSGMVGEIYLGGDGLTRGYTNPVLNQGKFIKGIGTIDENIYATGDLAYYDEEGKLYYLGRKDHQLKINGQRMEPEEVEILLKNCEGVSDAAVLFENNQLVAFYTGSNKELDPKELTYQLQQSLQESLIPKSFYYLKEMPRNDNGKISRKALKGFIPTKEKAEKLLPQAAIKKQLLLAWEKTLEKTNIYENLGFFEQGGSSLLLYKLKMEIKEHTGFEVEMVDLLTYATIDEQEKFLAKSQDRQNLKAEIKNSYGSRRRNKISMNYEKINQEQHKKGYEHES